MENIVILGGGFGGLKAAKTVARGLARAGLGKKYKVILVDRNDYHTYTPILYETATTSKEIANYCDLKRIVTFPFERIIRGFNIEIRKAEITALDLMGHAVHVRSATKDAKISFAYVVIALGSETTDFGIPGIHEYGMSLKTFADSLKIRDRVIEKLADNPKDIRVIVGGGGSTGVELAGELQEWVCELKSHDSRAGTCNFHVSLVEKSDALLSSLHPKIQARVTQRLQSLGVHVMTAEAISGVDDARVSLQSGRVLPYDIFAWTGGIKAPNVLGNLPIKHEKGAPITTHGLQCLPPTPHLDVHTHMYAIGDNVCFYDPITKNRVPAVARAAITQGRIAGQNIVEEIKAAEKDGYEPRYRTYIPTNYPYVVPAGGKWAAAKLGPIIFFGFAGWVFKGLVELTYFFSILPLGFSIKTWFMGLKIFIKNDRLG